MKRLIGGSGGANAAGGQAGNTQVQFNDNGAFGGDADFTYNKTTNQVTLGGDINLNDGGSFTTTLQVVTPTANRTISFPDATGTVGLVAGSSGQVVYNNAGAYAGVPSSVIGATGDVTLALNGAASTPPLELTGTWFTGGTSTTTKPQVLIEPAGATSTAWSTSGTGLGVNAASGFTGRLLDLQTNGTSRAVVTGGGLMGIGTATPSARLTVAHSDVDVASFSGVGNVYFTLSNGTGEFRTQLVSNSPTLASIGSYPLTLATNNTGRFQVKAAGGLLVVDANDFELGTTTGTKIGTATTQKLSFWNKSPVVQPTTAISAATFVANSGGSIHPTSTFDGYTIAQVVAALRSVGILA
jgi:hypothetical protein